MNFHCAACSWHGTEPHAVVNRAGVALRDECPRCCGHVREGSPCTNCGLESAFVGWDDCLACGCAELLHDDRAGIDAQRRLLAAHPHDLQRFNAELARQLSALVDLGRAIA